MPEVDGKLLNIYHVIEINPVNWPKVGNAGGKAFANFTVSGNARDTISRFGYRQVRGNSVFP